MADLLLSISQIIRATLTLPYLPNYHFALKTAQKRIDPRKVSYQPLTKELRVNGLGITIKEGQNEFLLDVLKHTDDLVKISGAEFSMKEDGTLVINVRGVCAEVRTAGEMEVLWEIFAQDVYNIDICKNHIVWDVGMNAGLASLFFAVCKKVKVYGFEPFPKTFSRAMANIALNPIASESVVTFMKGVAGSEGSMEVSYDSVNHGSNGLFGQTREPLSSLETAKIELAGAVEILDMIIAENPGKPIILKMDCEGSEYEIISALCRAGRLDELESILMEWHLTGDPRRLNHLEEDLRSAGFSFVTLHKADWDTGMIYAFHSVESTRPSDETGQEMQIKRSSVDSNLAEGPVAS